MLPIGLFFIGFGIVILVDPQILAYLIAFLFIIVGANILILTWIMRRGPNKSFRVGNYEVFRSKR